MPEILVLLYELSQVVIDFHGTHSISDSTPLLPLACSAGIAMAERVVRRLRREPAPGTRIPDVRIADYC